MLAQNGADNRLYVEYERYTRKVEWVTFDTYCGYFRKIYQLTTDTKLRDFQYRCLLLRLPTNMLLSKWKIKSSNECDYCTEIQDFFHMIWGCMYVQRIWMLLEREFSLPTLKYTSIVSCDLTDHFTSMIVLITKQWIFRQKCQNKTLRYSELKHEICQKEKIEKINALSLDRIERHESKWRPLNTDCKL